MATTTTPLSSFNHLCDAIPTWLIQLDGLTAQVAEQRSRFAHIAAHPGVHVPRKTHDSTESLRPTDTGIADAGDAAGAVPGTDGPCPQCLPARPNADSAMGPPDIRRKRKPGSAGSGASGPRYRTRSMVVVYYDSMIQEAFERLVRNIAAARNQIRKGKMAASFHARMASMGMAEHPAAAADEVAPVNPKGPRSRSIRRGLADAGRVHAFDEADGDLEAAQSLCEVGAHQFLRDGDCAEEIQGARARLANCLRVARTEVETGRSPEPDSTAAAPPDLTAEATRVQGRRGVTPRPEPDGTKWARGIEVDAPALKPVHYAGITAIEVDDRSDAESVEIDLSAFRRMRRV
jgi:hypothetical protein